MKNFIVILSLLTLLGFTVVSQAEIVYMHNDALGSPIMETNEQGAVISRSHYKPFGETMEAMEEGVGYTGHLNDTDLGLTYMQARYYDPVIGRFYSNDPIGFRDIHSFNRYTYANNNPYRYTDPDGRMPESFNEWVNFTVGVGKMASAGLQVVLGTGAIAAGIVDVVGGSKIVGVGLISYGTYSVVDSQYTAKDAGNRISDAWNNETGKNEHNVPEGIVEHIAQAADCSANCQSIAKTTDQVLGVASGNVIGTATKGNAILDTVSSVTDKLDKADGIIKNLDKVNK